MSSPLYVENNTSELMGNFQRFDIGLSASGRDWC